jgi:hypothetical protein
MVLRRPCYVLGNKHARPAGRREADCSSTGTPPARYFGIAYASFRFSNYFFSIGSVMQKTAPRGSFGVAQSRPPCASTIERQIERPIPKPVGLVV